MFNLIIRNAKLVDGTRSPARNADIAIKDGLIAEIGTVGSIKAKRPPKSTHVAIL